MRITFFQDYPYWGCPTSVNYFTQNLLSVLDVKFSETNALFLVHDKNTNLNSVYACGTNLEFQCGFKKSGIILPKKINLPDEPIQIATGKKHSLILTKDRKFYLIGKSKFLNEDLTHDIIRELPNFSLKENQEVIKMDCLDDNISLLIKN